MKSRFFKRKMMEDVDAASLIDVHKKKKKRMRIRKWTTLYARRRKILQWCSTPPINKFTVEPIRMMKSYSKENNNDENEENQQVSYDFDNEQPLRKRQKKKRQLLQVEPVSEEEANLSLAKSLKQPLYTQPDIKRELDYLVGLALTPLASCSPSQIDVIIRHLNGLQPDLSSEQLAKSVAYFIIRSGSQKQAMLEKPVLVLIRKLNKLQEWHEFETTFVETIPNCLTSPEGPTASSQDAFALAKVATWLCLLRGNRGGLLYMLAEILGRGGPKVAPACFGVFEVWPAVVGKGLFASCFAHAMHHVAESSKNEFTFKFKEVLKSQPSYPPPPMDKLLEAMTTELKAGSKELWHGVILLARINGARWALNNLLNPILIPISLDTNEENAAQAVITMGLMGRHVICGRVGGRAATRRTLLKAILDVLGPNTPQTMAEAVATGLVAAVGPGRPNLLKKLLQKIAASNVSKEFATRITLWSLKNLQPLFRKRQRSRKNENLEESQQDNPFTLQEPQFPETIKELLTYEDPLNAPDSELRFTI